MQNIKGIAQGVLKISPFENWSDPIEMMKKRIRIGKGNKGISRQSVNRIITLLYHSSQKKS